MYALPQTAGKGNAALPHIAGRLAGVNCTALLVGICISSPVRGLRPQ